MRIAVVGATGMIGSRIVAEAHSRGHAVTAVSRRGGADEVSAVGSVTADAADPAALAEIFAEVDVVVGATRPAPGAETDARVVATAMLAAAAATRRRLVVIGGAGPLLVPGTATLALDDPGWVPPAWRATAAASVEQLRTCERHPMVDWTYVSPPALIGPGDRTGRYRRGTTTLLIGGDGGSEVSAEDFAVAVVDELEAASGQRRLTFAGPRS
jgi:uncharacterized protein